jgi:alpha-galactosidase
MAAVPAERCVWAPEWVWDARRKQYLVFWASTTSHDVNNGDKRIWGRWTPDFDAWPEPPFVLLDPGFDAIDADALLLPNGTALLFFKDERGNCCHRDPRCPRTNASCPRRYDKTVRRASSLRGLAHIRSGAAAGFSNGTVTAGVTPQLTEGPEIVEFPNPTGQRYLLYADCFMDNHYAISSSDDLTHFQEIPGSSCVDYGPSIRMPGGNSNGSEAYRNASLDGPRHGSFVRISEEELRVLLKAYPSTSSSTPRHSCHPAGSRTKTDDILAKFRTGRGPSSASAATAAAAAITATILPGGALQLRGPAVTVTIISTFSAPGQSVLGPNFDFNRSLPPTGGAWQVQVTEGGGAVLGRVTGTCAFYRIERVYFQTVHGIIGVNDTIVASPDYELVGVQQRHYASVDPLQARIVDVVGPSMDPGDCTTPGFWGVPAKVGEFGEILGFASGTNGNPSIFASISSSHNKSGAVGIGLLALDDVTMVHAETVNHATYPCNDSSTGPGKELARPWAPAVQLADPHFAIAGGSRHTSEWAIVALGADCSSYWCYVNLVRNFTGVTDIEISRNGPLNGFEEGWLKESANNRSGDFTTWTPETTRRVLNESGMKYLITTIPWTDIPSTCEKGKYKYAHGSAFVHNLAPSCEQYIKDLVRVTKAADPDFKVLVYFHAFVSGETNASSKYHKDRVLRADGTQQCYASCCKEWPLFYPMQLPGSQEANAYAEQLDLYLDKVFELGADGIYHDESSYSVSPYTWITDPDRWDGVSAAFNWSLHPVAKVSSLNLLRQKHHIALMQRAASHGVIAVSNAMPQTRTYIQTRPPNSIHFVETGEEVRGYNTHHYTPLMLNRELAQSADRDPRYNFTVGDDPGLNLLAHLDYGALSHLCARLVKNGSVDSIYRRLTPITPVDVGRGYVLGRKKLVTKINSSVCWVCDGHEFLRAWIYNAEGELVGTQAATGVLNLSLPLRHVAIVEPVSSGKLKTDDGADGLLGNPDATPPISFWYAGVSSAQFLSSWLPWATNWTSKAAGVSHRRSGWNDPKSGLHVTVTETRYSAFPSAREWFVAFRQSGNSPSQLICNVSGLRVELPPPVAVGLASSAGAGLIHRFRGSAASATDFTTLVQPLKPGQQTAFGPFMGRSSDHTLPLFAVAAGSGGLVASVGWSGSWQVDVDRMSSTGTTTLDVWHGSGNSFGTNDGPGSLPSIPQNSSEYHDVTFCSQLMPGESVRLMRVLTVAFDGTDPQLGFNTHRQLLQSHKVPRDPRTGELLGALVTSDADGLTFPELMPPGGMGPVKNRSWHCPSCAPRQLNVHVPGLKAIGAEALWLDAYWFEGAFPNGVGNWTSPPDLAIDRNRWPDGLRPLSDAIRDNGMQFILWFEPERVLPGTWLARLFPEWTLPKHTPAETTLLDLGDPDAREYITDYVSEAIGDFGLSVWRTDYNIKPLGLWEGPPYANDATRRGMNEAKYINGLYRFWDDVRNRNDGILIDNCASGGRRIDLETISRSVPLWRTDFDGVSGCCTFAWLGTCRGSCGECTFAFGCGHMDNAAAQSMTMGLSQFVPINNGQATSWDPYVWRSTGIVGKTIYWGGAGFEHLLANASAMEQAQQAVAETKSLRPIVLHPQADYWPLYWGGAPYTYPDGTVEIRPTDDTWAAFQWHAAPIGGFVTAFRRESCASSQHTLALQGLEPAVTYSVRHCFTFECESPVEALGEDLMRNLTLHLPTPASSVLVRYAPVTKF